MAVRSRTCYVGGIIALGWDDVRAAAFILRWWLSASGYAGRAFGVGTSKGWSEWRAFMNSRGARLDSRNHRLGIRVDGFARFA